MDVTNAKHLQRLYGAIEASYRNLGTYRMSNRRLIHQYAGSDYGRRSIASATLRGPLPTVNLMHQTAESYQIALAYNCPRFSVTTWRPGTKSFVQRWKVALNNLVKMIHLEQELQPVILDAFFRIGVIKLVLPDNPRVIGTADPYIEQGLPYGARVGLDYWVHDTGCNDIRRAGFMGDMYTMRMEDAAKSNVFPNWFYRQLIPMEEVDQDEDYDKTESLSKAGYDNHETMFEPMVRLADIYLPRERLILTVQCDAKFRIKSNMKPLVRDWTGGDMGPYCILTFADIPDNAMPFSVAENLYGLSALYNNLLVKCSNRALKEKDVPWYTGSSFDDMKRAIAAADMTPIRIDHPNGFGVTKMGGVDSQLMLFDMNVMEIFNRMAGNLDLALGLGPTSPTASQDAQLGQAVAGKQAMMRRRTNRFVSQIGEGLGDIMWHNPDLYIPGTREPVPGLGPIDASWYPPDLMTRPGDFRDYGLEVEAYSMEYKSPQQRLNTIFALNQQVMPFMPLLMQNGTQFDGQKFLESVTELADSPEYADFWRHNGLPQQPPQDQSAMGGNQPREYIRTNVAGGATSQGRQHQMVQMMGQAAGRSNG